MDIMKTQLKQAKSDVESFCKAAFDTGDIPEPLKSAMLYSFMAGGKRLRPALLLESNRLLGGDREKAIPYATAIEMIHTYSLIHDDLPGMDNDDYRRGKLTNHKVFGEGMAILAGDGLLNAAYEIMLKASLQEQADHDRSVRAIQVLAERAGVTGMIAGQCADLDSEGKQVGDDVLDYIHTHKTADLIIGPLCCGGILAGASEKQLNYLKGYGTKLGLAFQITDDLLDVEGDAELLGKETGRDQVLNKQTFPQRYGIEGARSIAKKCIEEAKTEISKIEGDCTFFFELANYILIRKN